MRYRILIDVEADTLAEAIGKAIDRLPLPAGISRERCQLAAQCFATGWELASPVSEYAPWSWASWLADTIRIGVMDAATPARTTPAQPGDVCGDCALIGQPGALCPYHADTGIPRRLR